MSIEPLRGIEWIIATLKADATFTAACPGGVYQFLAPPSGVATPFCVVQSQGTQDIIGSNAYRLWTSGLYAVKCVGPATSAAAVKAAADEMDAALQRQSGTADGGTVLICAREQALTVPELVNGQELWINLGGLYRLLVQ